MRGVAQIKKGGIDLVWSPASMKVSCSVRVLFQQIK